MASWLFDRDAGKRRVDHIHEDGDGWVFESKYDIEPILRESRARKNSVSDYGPSRWKGKSHLVGQIPQPVVEQLIRERGREFIFGNDMRPLYKWLMESEQEPFRAMPGRF